MLVNFTNHPSDKWSNVQKDTAIDKYGTIKDIPFPDVDPEGDEEYIKNLAKKNVNKILELKKSDTQENFAVHIQGEFTLVYRMVTMLTHLGVTCVASTTRRIVEEHPDGTRTYRFEFVRFRQYE